MSESKKLEIILTFDLSEGTEKFVCFVNALLNAGYHDLVKAMRRSMAEQLEGEVAQ